MTMLFVLGVLLVVLGASSWLAHRRSASAERAAASTARSPCSRR